MNEVLEVVGIEVGKHLGSVQHVLPLRSVCREWRDTVTLSALEATLDLEPCGADASASTPGASRSRALFFKRCPQLRKLVYHVSPKVSLAQFEAAMGQLAERLPALEELELVFNNPAQQFETRHLAVLARLPRLAALVLTANFHPDACNFGAALGGLPRLRSLRLLASEASTGLSDGHVASLAGLGGLVELEFPGHARAFTGASLGGLAPALPRLARLAVTSRAPAAVDYSLSLPALAGLRALARRGAGAPPLELELGVPDASYGAALLRAVAGPGLRGATLAVREAADSDALAELLAAPGAARQLAGLDVEFRAAPSADDVGRLAACAGLRRLHLSCKCPRAPSTCLDVTPWLALSALEHLHLHINPAWRAPLQPGTLAAMAAAWPRLAHLHLRLSPADSAGHALCRLADFGALRSLSLTWLGQAAPAGLGGAARRRSLDVAALNLASLPSGLTELALTSISTVRLGLPLAGGGAARPVLPALRRLLLDGNFGVSDELLAGLFRAAPRLDSLSLVLTGRQTLSGAGLQAALAASAAAAAAGGLHRGLTALALADYREAPLCLSQASLAGLAGHGGLAWLRALKLSTPDVVHAELQPGVFAGFSRLRRLDLVGCQDQAAAALGAALPLCCIKPGPEWAGDAPRALQPQPQPAEEAAAQQQQQQQQQQQAVLAAAAAAMAAPAPLAGALANAAAAPAALGAVVPVAAA